LFTLGGIIALGSWFGKDQHNTRDYFLGGKDIPWWGIGLSIVAAETSALTIIGVPAMAYASQRQPALHSIDHRLRHRARHPGGGDGAPLFQGRNLLALPTLLQRLWRKRAPHGGRILFC
jgi:hypothetical protein